MTKLSKNLTSSISSVSAETNCHFKAVAEKCLISGDTHSANLCVSAYQNLNVILKCKDVLLGNVDYSSLSEVDELLLTMSLKSLNEELVDAVRKIMVSHSAGESSKVLGKWAFSLITLNVLSKASVFLEAHQHVNSGMDQNEVHGISEAIFNEVNAQLKEGIYTKEKALSILNT